MEVTPEGTVTKNQDSGIQDFAQTYVIKEIFAPELWPS